MSQRQLLTTQSGLQQRLQEVTLEEGQKLMVGYLQSLNELGFDSMRGMELRHRIVTELAVDIPLEEFIGSSTLAQVARLLLDQLVLTSVVQSAPLSPGLSDETEEITV
jgi:hypothetical protein